MDGLLCTGRVGECFEIDKKSDSRCCFQGISVFVVEEYMIFACSIGWRCTSYTDFLLFLHIFLFLYPLVSIVWEFWPLLTCI